MNTNYQELYQALHTSIGPNCIREIPRYARMTHKQKALIISDRGLVKIGTVQKICAVLSEASIKYSLYTEVLPNPSIENVNAAFNCLNENNCDFLIAIGGGSPMDLAKAVGILASNGGKIENYEGLNRSKNPSIPLIAINTTAGTGSEATRAYVITDPIKRVKMLMIDSNCLAFAALNDPLLMTDMPPALTAATGLDALTHAIEAYTARGHIPYTDGLALQAVSLISEYLPKAVSNGHNIEARSAMCWAAHMAGLAFSNAGLGLVHAMAHQLGGFYDIAHGVANAILLPFVMRYNSSVVQNRYKDIASAMGIASNQLSSTQASDALIEKIIALASSFNIPALKSTAFNPSDIVSLSLHVQSDSSYADNPCEVPLSDIQAIYMNAYRA